MKKVSVAKGGGHKDLLVFTPAIFRLLLGNNFVLNTFLCQIFPRDQPYRPFLLFFDFFWFTVSTFVLESAALMLPKLQGSSFFDISVTRGFISSHLMLQIEFAHFLSSFDFFCLLCVSMNFHVCFIF